MYVCTQELIDSHDVTIVISPQHALPTVSAERCRALHLHYHTPQAFGSIYTVQCSDITVHFKPPHREENTLELPEGNEQFISYLDESKIVTEKVIRGIYINFVEVVDTVRS